MGLFQDYMHHKYFNKTNFWTCKSFHEDLKPNRSLICIYKYAWFFQKNIVTISSGEQTKGKVIMLPAANKNKTIMKETADVIVKFLLLTNLLQEKD